MKDRRFTVVENSGMIGETDVATDFPDWMAAQRWIDGHYDRADELNPDHPGCLHVAIRQDWTDEETGEPRQEYVY